MLLRISEHDILVKSEACRACVTEPAPLKGNDAPLWGINRFFWYGLVATRLPKHERINGLDLIKNIIKYY